MDNKQYMNEITQADVRMLFDYGDGNLYWKVQKSNNVKIGDIAGGLSSGYQKIMVGERTYLTHRLIFLYHYGYLPQFLDHIDGNKSNNDINNLRAATKSQNSMNKKKDKSYNDNSTSSQFKGVCRSKNERKYQSYITVDGKQKYLGRYDFELEAAIAYNRAAIGAFGEFAKLNEVN